MITTSLPADVYDAYEFASFVYGGIGAQAFEDTKGNPLCIAGYKRFLFADSNPSVLSRYDDVPLSVTDNDDVVRRVNKSKGKRLNSRISWAEYVENGGIKRIV